MKKNKFIFNKLVRDNIPEIMEKLGAEVITKNLSSDQQVNALKDKLIEETKEIIQANSKKELIEELADVFEVLYCLAKIQDIELSEIETARINKLNLKGNFNQLKFIDHILIENNFKFIDYYRSQPKKYPETKD